MASRQLVWICNAVIVDREWIDARSGTSLPHGPMQTCVLVVLSKSPTMISIAPYLATVVAA